MGRTTAIEPAGASTRDGPSRLLRAGLLTGITDFLFASVLNVAFYGSTVTRVWEGVASTVLGRGAIGGGFGPAALGVLMHFGVAFFWSAVFLAVYRGWSALRTLLQSTAGLIAVTALYGPLIWLTMSMGVIPLLVDHPAGISLRWWVQLAGHVPFVALPIVATVSGRLRRTTRAD